MEGDRLWHVHELVYVVAPNRDEAEQYLYGEGHTIADGDEWPGLGSGLGEYLTLESPHSEVGLPDENGDVWLQTALEYATSMPTGTVVGYDDDEDDD